jgi:hypothetical protein
LAIVIDVAPAGPAASPTIATAASIVSFCFIFIAVDGYSLMEAREGEEVWKPGIIGMTKRPSTQTAKEIPRRLPAPSCAG